MAVEGELGTVLIQKRKCAFSRINCAVKIGVGRKLRLPGEISLFPVDSLESYLSL